MKLKPSGRNRKKIKQGSINNQMMRYRIVIFLLVCFYAVTGHFVCAGYLAGIDTNYTLLDNKIVIASEPNYPPYCIVDEEGNADGFSVDLFRAAARAAGLETEINIGVWSKIMEDLAEGRIDALPLVGRTPEREDLFDFTLPYMSLHGAVFVRRGTTGINSLEDLKDKEIIVMRGDNAEEFVMRNNISDKIITTHTFKEAFQILASGQHDAVIMQRITGINLLDETGIRSVVPLDFQMPQFRQDFCFAVRKGDSLLLNRLNEGLSIVIADGTYNEIRFKWFGPAFTEELTINDIIRIIGPILIPLIFFMSVFWIISLRRQVRKQTRVLNDEISEHKNTFESLHKQKLMLNEMEKVTRSGGWEYETDTKTITWTEGVYEIFGVNSADFYPSDYNKSKSFYNPSDQIELDKAFNNALETGESYDLELRLNLPGGHEKWVQTKGFAEKNDSRIVRLYGNIVDITDRKEKEIELIRLKEKLENEVSERTAELQEQVRKLNKSQEAMLYMVEDLNITTNQLKEEREKLEFSNKELEAFSYSVSHDLRAPLRAINGFARFLDEDYSDKIDDEGRRFINTILRNASHMDILITDIMNLSRVSRASLNPNLIDMKAIVRSMFHEIATDKEVEDFEFEIQKMPKVICDPSLIKQVWQNLISNALKYSSKSKTKKITVGATTDNRKVTFYIKDHGIGFDGKYKQKLFDVFQRLHGESVYKGTGVGLAIVHRIIRRHGGEVWAEGKVKEGSVFYFSLPANNKKS